MHSKELERHVIADLKILDRVCTPLMALPSISTLTTKTIAFPHPTKQPTVANRYR